MSAMSSTLSEQPSISILLVVMLVVARILVKIVGAVSERVVQGSKTKPPTAFKFDCKSRNA